MNIHQDFEEFLAYLNDEDVCYLIVGGYAVAFFGYVRATNDMDIFFEDTEENVSRMTRALKSFGLAVSPQQREQFFDPGSRIRLGVSPVCIEMINRISGVSFGEAWGNRTPGKYGDVQLFYLSREDLLKNKKTSARLKDLADIDELGG